MSPVPEELELALLGLGFLALVFRLRAKRNEKRHRAGRHPGLPEKGTP